VYWGKAAESIRRRTPNIESKTGSRCSDAKEYVREGSKLQNNAKMRFVRQSANRDKKEEFPGFMEPCRLGTPFPRSALFLLTALWKTVLQHKST
jgi:hypothetical protein